MPVTITAGVTFSGGMDMTFAPPVVGTAGWYGGGNGPSSTINRITFATDTATATARGPLSSGTYKLGATGNLTYGWFGGGVNVGVAPFYSFSTVQRVTYATDTATASVKGPLVSARRGTCAMGNTTSGWFGGGYGVPAPNGGSPLSIIDRITYATDTASASQRGPLSLGRKNLAAASDNTTDGWYGGGNSEAAPFVSLVDRITFATDTATASVRGPLTSARYYLSAMSNTTYGWFCGGTPGGAYNSLVDRITFATDTAAASIRGPLSLAKRMVGAAGNDTDGWVSGGASSPGPISTVDRITYATDTTTASVRGALSSARYGLAGAAGLQ